MGERNDHGHTTLDEMFLERLALTRCIEQYREACEDWSILEAKAQGVAAIAGVFVAAIFAFLGHIEGSGKYLVQCSVSLCTVLLLVSIAFCLRVLWLQDYKPPPSGESVLSRAKDVAALNPEERRTQMPHVIETLCSDWKPSLIEMERVVESKAKDVRWAQRCLAAAIGCGGLAVLIRIWG